MRADMRQGGMVRFWRLTLPEIPDRTLCVRNDGVGEGIPPLAMLGRDDKTREWNKDSGAARKAKGRRALLARSLRGAQVR
jgi:hypothetical protein